MAGDENDAEPFAVLDDLWKEKEKLRRAEEDAMAVMPPAQIELDYGDHWVLPQNETVLFGYVPTLIEMAAQFSEELLPQDQVDSLLLHSQYEMTRGWMSCEIDGDRYYWIHKTLCIPIGKEMYEKARAVNWEPSELSDEDLHELSLTMIESRSDTLQHFRSMEG